MKLAVLDAQGKEVRKLDVDETVFGIQPNVPVLHQAYVAQRANMRAGTSSTKTRGEVQGSTRKIRRQKYTGAARAGSVRSPTRVGGGIAFGPKPRSYAKSLNKKMRRLAIRSALSGKLADGQLVVIDQLAMETPKTKEMLRLLAALGLERSALVVTGGPDRHVLASVRNLDKTKMLPAAYLNVVDMMNHAGLLMTEEAVRVAESLWGKKEVDGRVRLAPRQKLKVEEKPRAPSRASRARLEGEPEVAEAAPAPEAEIEAEAPPSRRTTRFVPKERPGAPTEAEAEAKPARARRAPTAEGAAETAEAPKPAARRRKAEPAEEAPAVEGEAKPKRPRAKAEKTAEGEEAPKPRRRTTKKSEEGE
jgi:large subunit ribosomal protein L4